MTNWLSSDVATAALLDEIVKIGEDAAARETRRERILRGLRTAGLAAGGSAAGLGAAMALRPLFPAPTPKVLRAVQIGLPILGGTAMFLGSKYRQQVNEGLSGSSRDDR